MHFSAGHSNEESNQMLTFNKSSHIPYNFFSSATGSKSACWPLVLLVVKVLAVLMVVNVLAGL